MVLAGTVEFRTGAALDRHIAKMQTRLGNDIGISSESLSHVFERFYRVEKSRSRATAAVLA